MVPCSILNFGCVFCGVFLNVHMGFFPLPECIPVGGFEMLNYQYVCMYVRMCICLYLCVRVDCTLRWTGIPFGVYSHIMSNSLYGDMIGQLRKSTELLTHSNTLLCLLSCLYTVLIKGNMVRCEIGRLSDSVLDVDLSQMRGCEVLF